jgi:cell filamentation protein
MPGRYAAAGPEAEFQPGSRGRVLRNRLGITSVRELERNESEILLAVTQRTIDETRIDQRFTAADIRRVHHSWLGVFFPLREYTPCKFDTALEQATALAIVHAELILIHPFRVMLH